MLLITVCNENNSLDRSDDDITLWLQCPSEMIYIDIFFTSKQLSPAACRFI